MMWRWFLLLAFGGLDIVAAKSSNPPLCGQVLFMAGQQPVPRRDDWVQHTRVLINEGTGPRAIPSSSGRFCFHGLDPTIGYTLTVMSNEYMFPTMYAQCDPTTMLWAAHYFNALEGPVGGKGGVTPDFRPISRIEAFDQKQALNPLGMLKNPMVIMGIVSMGMVFIMPMLTEGMTEEEKRELAQQNPMNAEGGLMGMLSSLTQPPEEAPKSIKKKT